MAIVRPFSAIRPKKELAAEVIALPYDVMNRREAAEQAAGKKYSFLRISRSEIDLPQEENPYCQKVYEKAKENLGSFLREGALIRDQEPTLYIYEQTMDGRSQTGIVGCVSVDEYESSVIKKHEFTRVEKEQDRINHFDICNANTEPVFLAYRDRAQISAVLKDYCSGREPEYDILGQDKIGHRLWKIEDQAVVSELVEAFKEVPSFYIADGHHRSASAYKVGLKRRAENPKYTGQEEFNYFMAVIFPAAELKVFDYNRTVKDLNGYSDEEFLEAVKNAGFILEQKGEQSYRPGRKHEFSMYLSGIWYSLTAKEDIIPKSLTGSLDVSILQDNLLDPILGIKDPRTDKRIDFIGGIRGLEELKGRADGDMKVSFAVFPVTMDDLFDVSDGGMVMPPKSTWFEPKLASGLFVHQL